MLASARKAQPRKWCRTAAVVGVLLASSATLPASVSHASSLDGLPQDRLPHPPIRITSDAEFTALNGVVGGRGTADDPFVIAGWDIEPGPAHVTLGGPQYYPVVGEVPVSASVINAGIVLLNTSAHVVMRDNEFHNGNGAAILVHASGNVRIEDNAVHDLAARYYTFIFRQATKIAIRRNTIEGSSSGIVGNGTDVTVDGNTVSDCESTGIGLDGSNLTVVDNTVRRCWAGLYLSFSTDVRVDDNVFTDNAVGISTWGCNQGSPDALQNLTASRNTVSGGGTAAELSCLQGFHIEDNRFSDAVQGVTIVANEVAEGRPSAVRGNRIDRMGWTPLAVSGFPKPYLVEWEENVANGLPTFVFSEPRDATFDGNGAEVGLLMVVDGHNASFTNWRVQGPAWSRPWIAPVVIARGNTRLVGNTITGAIVESYRSQGQVLESNALTGAGFLVLEPEADLVLKGNHVLGPEAVRVKWAGGPGTIGLEHNFFSSPNGCTVCVEFARNLTATENTILNAGSDAPIDLRYDASMRFNHNTIIGASGTGSIARSEGQDVVDARWNWWGSAEGPQPANGTTHSIEYSPWLLEPPADYLAGASGPLANSWMRGEPQSRITGGQR